MVRNLAKKIETCKCIQTSRELGQLGRMRMRVDKIEVVGRLGGALICWCTGRENWPLGLVFRHLIILRSRCLIQPLMALYIGIQVWFWCNQAHDYVEPLSDDQSTEEAAEEYFQILVQWRFQDFGWSEMNQTMTFKFLTWCTMWLHKLQARRSVEQILQ